MNTILHNEKQRNGTTFLQQVEGVKEKFPLRKREKELVQIIDNITQSGK